MIARLLFLFGLFFLANQSWGMASVIDVSGSQYDTHYVTLDKYDYDYDAGSYLFHSLDQAAILVLDKRFQAEVSFSLLNDFHATKSVGKVDPNKLNHIFGQSRHNLDGVVKQFGSQEKAFNAIQQATETAARSQGLKGVFETTVKVGTENITIRGNIVDGAVKVGTAFRP